MTPSPNTCRCDKSAAPEAQELCPECDRFQVIPCALCRTPIWWTDAITTEDGLNVCVRCETYEIEGVPV